MEEASGGRQVRARGVRTREKLLDAAIQCLVDVGYGRTTTTLVCEVAGLSRGAQLHHFPTKEELVIAALQRNAAQRFAQIRAQGDRVRRKSAGRSVSDQVRLGVELLAATFSGTHFVAAMELWQASRTEPALKGLLLESERTQMREVHKLCETLFPEVVTSDPAYRQNLGTIGYLMRGLALTRLLKDDAEETERVLKLCVSCMMGESSLGGASEDGDNDAFALRDL